MYNEVEMNRRKLHHVLVVLRPVSYWYFVIIVIISGGVAALALRQNNLTALHLRDTVLETDKNDGDVETALRDLREYVYGHMNARLHNSNNIYPPIQLVHRYERLAAAEKARVQSANETIYRDAQASCEARFPQGLSGGNRIPCIQQYVDSHGGAKEQPIPDAVYKFDFLAPVWSPDLAGWAVAVCALATMLLALRIAAQVWLKQQLDT